MLRIIFLQKQPPAFNQLDISDHICLDGLLILSFSPYIHSVRLSLQLREKRRQMFLKTTSDGRQRAKQKRVEEDLERERKNQLDEKKRLYVPRLLNAS